MHECADFRPGVHVVDDDAALRESLKCALMSWGLHVTTYSSAKSLLDAYADRWTGCLLVDYRMPDMNGIELLRSLKVRRSSLRGIFMTGEASEDLLSQAIAAGAIAVLEKPFHALHLKNVMQREFPVLFGADLATA